MPSPKPEPPAKAPSAKRRHKPGPGRGKKFEPTREQRLTVEFMAGAGIPEDDMARVVINPRNNEAIGKTTLRKHFKAELDQGHIKADMTVAQRLYKNAITATPTYPGGIPVAQIFWLKTRARWRTADKVEPTPAAPQTADEMDAKETARRMAFLLAAGAAQAEHEAGAKRAHHGKKKIKITA